MTNLIKTGPTYVSGNSGNGRFTLKPDSVNDTQDAITKTITVRNSITGDVVTFTFTQNGKSISLNITDNITWVVDHNASISEASRENSLGIMYVDTPSNLIIELFEGPLFTTVTSGNTVSAGVNKKVVFDWNSNSTGANRIDIYKVKTSSGQYLKNSEGKDLLISIILSSSDVAYNIYTSDPVMVFRTDKLVETPLGNKEPLYIGKTQRVSVNDENYRDGYPYKLTYTANDANVDNKGNGYIPVVFGSLLSGTTIRENSPYITDGVTRYLYGQEYAIAGEASYQYKQNTEDAPNATDKTFNISLSHTPSGVISPYGSSEAYSTILYSDGYYAGSYNGAWAGFVYNDNATEQYISDARIPDSYNTITSASKEITFLMSRKAEEMYSFQMPATVHIYALSNAYISSYNKRYGSVPRYNEGNSLAVTTINCLDSQNNIISTPSWVTISSVETQTVNGTLYYKGKVTFSQNTSSSSRSVRLGFDIQQTHQYTQEDFTNGYANQHILTPITIKQLGAGNSDYMTISSISQQDINENFTNVGTVNYIPTRIIENGQPFYIGVQNSLAETSSSDTYVSDALYSGVRLSVSINGGTAKYGTIVPEYSRKVYTGTVTALYYEFVTRFDNVYTSGATAEIKNINSMQAVELRNSYVVDNLTNFSGSSYPQAEIYLKKNTGGFTVYGNPNNYIFTSVYNSLVPSVEIVSGDSNIVNKIDETVTENQLLYSINSSFVRNQASGFYFVATILSNVR